MMNILVTLLGLLFSFSAHSSPEVTVNVMGPLLVGNPHEPLSSQSAADWNAFEAQLRRAKQLGVNAVSTDVWWGLIEPQKGQFQWEYYDKLVATIEKAGLRWMPILSFHQLGGNVGDSGYIPVPRYVWSEGGAQTTNENGKLQSPLMFKSEHGNTSAEYVSYWADNLMKDNYRRVMAEFQKHFAAKVAMIEEVNISMGPAGELRYPSYNAHDGDRGAFPKRGSLQAYSEMAVQSFRAEMKRKYGSIQNVNAQWGFRLRSFEEIYPPNPDLLESKFFETREHFSPYGRDFFDWYNESLVQHGKMMMGLAFEVFAQTNSPMKQVTLGAKVPGVHWRVSTDRLAELSAGLLRTSYKSWYSSADAFGYKDVFRVFTEVPNKDKVVMHFTAIEMADRDYEGDWRIDSRAESLTQIMGRSAKERGVTLKGENALAGSLHHAEHWQKMKKAMGLYGYSGVTLLRINEISGAEFPESQLWNMTQSFSSVRSCSRIFGN